MSKRRSAERKPRSDNVFNMWDRKPIIPKNDKQAEYLKALKNHSIIVSTGVAGSGKTALAAWTAIDMLEDPRNNIEKIIIARPNEGKAKTAGFLPGTKEEKLEGWVAPVADHIKQRIGAINYEKHLKAGKIELLLLEQIKGRSHNNCFVIIDEAEDLELETMKSLLTRQGKDCITVINGDIAQRDLKARRCGLDLLNVIFDNFQNVPAALVDFDSWEYNVRSPESAFFGEVIEILEREKKI